MKFSNERITLFNLFPLIWGGGQVWLSPISCPSDKTLDLTVYLLCR